MSGEAARAEERRRRALAPVRVAQILGVPVADLARAMRAAGVAGPLTEAQAGQWNTDPESVPEWLGALRGDRLARAAEKEYRRQQREEERQLCELAAEQSAMAKVKAGKTRFSDTEWAYVEDWAFRAAEELVRVAPVVEATDLERRVLRLVGVVAGDHSTWLLHAGGCDGVGRARCAVRIQEMHAARRADALIESVAKETALRVLSLASGQFVTTWHGSRVGMVVRLNKVTVKVRMIGGRKRGRNAVNAVVEMNLDPRSVSPAPESLPLPPAPGDEVVLRDHQGHSREAQVVAVDGPLFEATYSLRSGQWRSGWFDLLAIVPESSSRCHG